MKLIHVPIDNHNVLRVEFTDNSKFIKEAERIAYLKAKHVHINDAADQPRDFNVRLSQNFLGALADLTCAEILRRYFKKHSFEFKIERYDDVRTDDFENSDLYDIKLIAEGKEYIVEIRSSACLFIPLERLINEWHILGPYTSKVKGRSETDSDFYFRPIYHLNQSSKLRKENSYTRSKGMEAVCTGSMSLYFVGGAPLDLLQRKGRNEKGEELKQKESNFRVIDIRQGLDAPDFLKKLVTMLTNKPSNIGNDTNE